MKLIGQTKITTIEEPDTLEFVAIREDGLVDFLFGPIVIIAFGIWAWLSRDWRLIIVSIVAVGYVIAYRSNGNVSRLSVNRWALTISDGVEKHSNHQTVIAPFVNKSFEYLSGGEDGPAGIYQDEMCIFEGFDRK